MFNRETMEKKDYENRNFSGPKYDDESRILKRQQILNDLASIETMPSKRKSRSRSIIILLNVGLALLLIYFIFNKYPKFIMKNEEIINGWGLKFSVYYDLQKSSYDMKLYIINKNSVARQFPEEVLKDSNFFLKKNNEIIKEINLNPHNLVIDESSHQISVSQLLNWNKEIQGKPDVAGIRINWDKEINLMVSLE